MMRATLAIATMLALGGCHTAVTITEGEPELAKLSLPPSAAALCITRNLERAGINIMADRRPLGPDGHEVVARVTASFTTIYLVAHLQPSGSGSTAKLWIAAHLFRTGDSVAKEMTNGC